MKAPSQLNTHNFYGNNIQEQDFMKKEYFICDEIDHGYDMIKFFRR